MLAPCTAAEDLVDRTDGDVELLITRVEVRRDANARARPLIHDYVPRELAL